MKKFIAWINEHPIFTALGISAIIIGIIYLVKGDSNDVKPEPQPEPVDNDTTIIRSGRTYPRSSYGLRTVSRMGSSGINSSARVNQGSGNVSR